MEDTQDFGTKQTRAKKDFSTPFVKQLKLSPYFCPSAISVAGESTSIGKSLAGTFLDDGRANLAWSAEHEQILFGLLTSSSLIRVKEPAIRDGSPLMTGENEQIFDEFSVLVGEGGQPELVFLQGNDTDWYLVMQDGRQRRKAALEGTRRLEWIANIFCRMTDKSKPARRNMLIKLAAKAAKHVDLASDWKTISEEVTGFSDVPPYSSPEGEHLSQLHWLTETFARVVVGDEKALGDSTKKGCFYSAKKDDAERLGVEEGSFQAYPIWLKVAVVGINVDPNDPGSLADAVAAKEAQVPTPPSLFAKQVVRLLNARQNPSDPNSPKLYSKDAVASKLGKSLGTLENYTLLHELCDEVMSLIDSGEMSIAFAVGGRESAFVTWPKGQTRQVLPMDKQRLVLSHLLHELAEDASGEKIRFRGDKALALGKKLRDAAASGKLAPVGAVDEDTTPVAIRPVSAKPKTESPTPVKRPKATIDLVTFRAAIEARINSLPEIHQNSPAKQVSKLDEELGALALARSVALVVCGAEPVAVLDQWPAVRDAIASAIVATRVSAAPQQSEEMFLLDLISVAIEEMERLGTDHPKVTEQTISGGKTPTAAQAEICNNRLAEWIKDFNLDQEAKLLEDYLMTKVVAAQNADLSS